MASHAAAFFPLETGGVLVGYVGSRAIEVTGIVGPGPNARHAPTRFSPDAVWQAERIAELYAESGRRLSYLGDWHSHPKGTPAASQRDRATLRHIAAYPDARCPDPLMLILGGTPTCWDTRLYRLRTPHRPPFAEVVSWSFADTPQ